MPSRIVTHTDFDGVVSAVLLRAVLGVERVWFEEPWRVQQGLFRAQKGDVLVDLPYAEGCELWFDHHSTSEPDKERGVWRLAPSAARVVYEHYKDGHDLSRFAALVDATDKIDSAAFTKEDLEHPDVYGKLSMAIRGDDRRKDDEFRRFLIEMLLGLAAEQVVAQPIIRKRVEEKLRQHEEWRRVIPEYVTPLEHVILVDRTRAPPDLPRGQPFWLYLQYPGRKVFLSVSNIEDDPDRVRFSCGENIFEDLNAVDIGALMQRYGGGGHKAAGGCSVPKERKDEVLKELVGAFDE